MQSFCELTSTFCRILFVREVGFFLAHGILVVVMFLVVIVVVTGAWAGRRAGRPGRWL